MKLRLVKVLVRPVFVTDDGVNLAEVPEEFHEVAGKDWNHDYIDRFYNEMKDTEEKLNELNGAGGE